jgi:hypothetical protein
VTSFRRFLRVRRVRAMLALAFTTLTLTLAFGASSVSAGLGIACPDPTTQPFRAWSDFARYAQVPDGGFEAGGSGWTFAGGAKVVQGNNPFYLRSTADRSSLLLPAAGSSATSPPMCISLLSSKMRFVAGGPKGSSMKVQVLYRGLLSNVLGVFDGGTVNSSGQWAPSPEMAMLGGLLPLLTRSVQFRFVATSGSPQVDDVFLDPWKIG